MKKKSIEVWLYHAESCKFLLLQVSNANHNFWQPITGGIEAGETARQAAKREIFEETSQIVTLEALKKLGEQQVKIDEELTILKTVFFVPVTTQKCQISDEHIASKWASEKQVLETLYWSNNIESFAWAKKFIAQN